MIDILKLGLVILIVILVFVPAILEGMIKQKNKMDRLNAATPKPDPIYNLLTGIIIATDDQLQKQNLHIRFKPGEMVYVKLDSDRAYYQISRNGNAWYSIYRQQVSIDE